MPPKDSADWTTNPEDVTHVLDFLHKQRSRVGQGGNFDKTVFNEAAEYMAREWPPKKGGPKTASAIMSKYKAVRVLASRQPSRRDGCPSQMRKLHEYILQALQKVYPGASGWTYTHEHGFNVKDEDQDAWNNFAKAHSHFKPFATQGWVHFQKMDEIIPSQARGRYVYNAGASQPDTGASQPADDASGPDLQSPDNDFTQSSDLSQPFSDEWSQSNYGDSQSQAPDATQPAPSRTTAPPVPTTPASTLKRSPADVEVPWSSSKRSRVTGPESILALGRSVEGIGKVIETVLAPPKASSAISPTKKVATARAMALDDMNNGYILADERTCLHILFGRDTTAADAYISDEDALLRAAIGRELLAPTQMFNYR
ncbi:hypothetical protein C8R43DRAFT_940469 [Mycena crocata]|nr:hypothetical protein C8R43DRAFT_940469 [Mycena crocata]